MFVFGVFVPFVFMGSFTAPFTISLASIPSLIVLIRSLLGAAVTIEEEASNSCYGSHGLGLEEATYHNNGKPFFDSSAAMRSTSCLLLGAATWQSRRRLDHQRASEQCTSIRYIYFTSVVVRWRVNPTCRFNAGSPRPQEIAGAWRS